MPFYAKSFHHGVVHGIDRKGALTIVAVLSDDMSALLPLPESIGLASR
jgi:hypothetical protein